MGGIRILADSSSDMPRSLVEELGIIIIPTPVQFGEEKCRDWVDFTPEQFYQRMRAEEQLPRTSQPEPTAYLDQFQKAHSEGMSVICVCLSSGLSGGFQSAELARRELPEADITVVDSRAASLGFGLLVINLARDIQNGLTREQALERFEDRQRRLYSFFTLNTLDNLKKGGRVSGVAAVFGSMLNIKPVLHLNTEGRIEIVDKVRGREKALSRLIELATENGEGLNGAEVGVSHAHCLDDARGFAEKARNELGVGQVIISDIGAAVGTHTGVGCIAFFLFGKPRW